MSFYSSHSLGRPLLAVLCYNNGTYASSVLSKIPIQRDYDVLVINDGSSDGTGTELSRFPFPQIINDENHGIGFCIKKAIQYAKEKGNQVLVIMAGNNKDNPQEIDQLLTPIYQEGFDYVQGSRYLKSDQAIRTPWFRKMMVPLHAKIFSWLTGFSCTDALNGYRAYKISLFYEPIKINIWQDWLNRYEFETYLHYHALIACRVKEVAVTKSYASYQKGKSYSHIRPWVDWWKIMSPLLYLKLGIRK